MKTFRSVLVVAVLLCAAASCDSNDATGAVEPVPDLQSLTVNPSALPADGRTLTVVRATIPAESRVLPRQVTFTTSAGTFLPQGSAGVTTLVVPVDPEGVAVALLQAPQSPTMASVTARAGETTLQQTVQFVQALPDLASFETSANEVVADDVSTLALRATIRDGSTLSPRSVTFETTGGVFQSTTATTITVSADGSGTALALLRAPQLPGEAIIRAKAGTSVIQRTIQFTRAYPESIVLGADSFRIGASAGKSLKLQVNLVRSLGRVSPGATLSMTPVDSLGSERGWFAGVLETSPGVFQAYYTPGETPYRGPVDVIARTAGAGGATIEGRLRLQVTNP